MRSKTLIALGAFLLSGAASATQLPYPTISGLIDTQLPTNQNGTISAASLRGVLHNMLDSVPVTDAIYPATQAGSTYTYQTLDQASSYTFTSATPAITLQKPVALPTTATQIGRGWFAIIGAGPSSTATITPTGSLINNSSTLTLHPNASYIVSTDGANYFATIMGPQGVVNSGTAGQVPVYAIAGNSLSPEGPFAAGLPILGNGTSGLVSGTRQGTSTTYAATSGSFTNGNCRSTDSSGNEVDAGVSCGGGGGGSGTVTSATINQIGVYPATGNTIAGNPCTISSAGIISCPHYTMNNASANGFAPGNQALWAVGTYTGSGTGPYAEYSVTDTAGNPTAGTALTGINVDYSINSGASEGNRTAIQAILNHNVSVSGTNNLKFYTAMFPQAYSNTPDGGTLGAEKGALYGIGVISQLNAGATNWQGVGSEIDTAVLPGASVAHKSVLALIGVNGDAVAGSVSDAMLIFTKDGISPAIWHKGIAFGRPDSLWPFGSGSTLIGTYAPVTGTRAIGAGIDFTGLTFAGFALATPGFTVDGAGNERALTNTATSDSRLKENVAPVTAGLDKIMALRPVDYNFIADTAKKRRAHFIAQEAGAQIPESLYANQDGYFSLDDGAILAYAVKAIQELKHENDALRAAITPR